MQRIFLLLTLWLQQNITNRIIQSNSLDGENIQPFYNRVTNLTHQR